jgi:hypothetical protein
MTHPAKTKRKVCKVSVVPVVATIAKTTAHTAAHPMLYAV